MSEFGAVNPSSLGITTGPFSQAFAAGGFLFISGQVALDEANELVGSGDIVRQTTVAIGRLRSVLSDCGADLDRIVSATAFLRSADLFVPFNRVWADAFGIHRPARATVVTDFVMPGVLVEIQAIACRP